MVRMGVPLLELREKIEQFRGSVEGALVALKNGLKQRSEAASTREVLKLLLDTFQVVSKGRLSSRPLIWTTIRLLAGCGMITMPRVGFGNVFTIMVTLFQSQKNIAGKNQFKGRRLNRMVSKLSSLVR